MSIYTDAVRQKNFDSTMSSLTRTLEGPEGKKTKSKITSSTQVKDLLNALKDGADIKGEIKRDWENSFLINPANAHLFNNSSTQEALVSYLGKLADESPEALATFLKSPTVKAFTFSQAKDSDALKALYDYVTAPDSEGRKNELHNTLSKYLHIDGYGISALGGEVGELQESSNALISAMPGLALRTLDNDVKDFKATFRENENGERQFEIEESVTRKEAETIVNSMSFLTKDGGMQVGDVYVAPVTIKDSDVTNLGFEKSKSPIKSGETFNFREWFIDIQSFTDKDDLSQKASKALLPYAVLLARSENLINQGKVDEAKEIQKQMKALKKVMTKGYKVKGKVLNLFREGLKQGISKDMLDLIAKKRSDDTEARTLTTELNSLKESVNSNVAALFDNSGKALVYKYDETSGELKTETRDIKSVELHDESGQRKTDAEAKTSLEGILEQSYNAMDDATKKTYSAIHNSVSGEDLVENKVLKELKAEIADFANSNIESKNFGDVLTKSQELATNAVTKKALRDSVGTQLTDFTENFLGSDIVEHGGFSKKIREINNKTTDKQTDLDKKLLEINSNIKKLSQGKITFTDLVNSLTAAKSTQDTAYDKNDDKELLKDSFTSLMNKAIQDISSKDELEEKVSNDSILRSLFKADGKTEASDKRATKALAEVLKEETKNANIDSIIEGTGLLKSGPLARLLHAKDLRGNENEINNNVRLYGILAIAQKAIAKDASETDNITNLIAKELVGEKTKDQSLTAYNTKLKTVKDKIKSEISGNFASNAESVIKINDQVGDLTASVGKIIWEKSNATGIALVDFANKFLGEAHIDILKEGFSKAKTALKTGLDTYSQGGKSAAEIDQAAKATFGDDATSAKSFYGKLTQGSQDLFDTDRTDFGRNGLISSLRKAYIIASTFLNNVFSSSSESATTENKKSYDYLLNNGSSDS